MHENSLFAWANERFSGRIGERAAAILAWVEKNGPATDRDVMAGLGFHEPNAVRPRITELIRAGKVREVGSAVDRVTGKRVRRISASA